MEKTVVISTGGNAGFFSYIEQAILSLLDLNLNERATIGVLDLGLTEPQLDRLKDLGCIIRKPRWTFSMVQPFEITHEIGLVARTALPEYFPGFDLHIWFDADAWAQTPEFFDRMLAGAMTKGAAVIRENGIKYKRDYKYMRWWFGNMAAVYGLFKGLRLGFQPVINIGIMAIATKAPHWKHWIAHYEQSLLRRKRINLDQHAFNAAIELDELPHELLPARCNWICTLSQPIWDPVRKLLCEPDATATPISVIHMAGPNKARIYDLEKVGGGSIPTAVTYAAIKAIKAKSF